MIELAMACVVVSTTLADDPLDDFDWVIVGAPGNRDTIPEEVPLFPSLVMGGVDHYYKLALTEVTVGQWFEFVNAYWPYDDEPDDNGLTSDWIYPTNPDAGPGEDPGYVIVPGSEEFPANMEWYMAARYCNWLHNGKVSEQWAFEDGAYDASDFGDEGDGPPYGGPETHRPDALVWIPSRDELVKGLYYDPHRHGLGEGGYWYHPDSGMEKLISGLPEEGGETSGGIVELIGFPVAQYPWVRSPWGLLDGSAGRTEWTELITFNGSRFVVGSETGDIGYGTWDALDGAFVTFDPTAEEPGVRLATRHCAADFNQDGHLNVLDFVAFQQALTRGLGADLNWDGRLDVLDLIVYVDLFGRGCSWY